MIASRDPLATRLYQALTRTTRFMPLGGTTRLSERELAIVRDWIASGAPKSDASASSASANPFISERQASDAILNDISNTVRPERKYKRYFTLTTLTNAGLSKDLPARRLALTKLLNSLS